MIGLRKFGGSLLSGEGLLPLILLVLGAYWVVESINLNIWNGSQPGTGLMPLIYGSLLVAFSVAVIAFSGRETDEQPQDPARKPLLLLALLILTVVGFPLVGGVASVFLMMAIMFIFIEHLPPIRSIAVSALVAAFFAVVFDHWLSVTLPHGPWGF